MNPSISVLLAILGLIVITQCRVAAQGILGNFLYPGEFTDPEKLDLEQLRARGYDAEQFYIESQDGYILSLVRGRNPLLDYDKLNKDPVLFLHGLLVSSTVWTANSKGVRPKDFTRLGPFENEQQLQEALRDEPSAKVFPYLLMNFGHEIWLLTRRGYPKSDGKAGHLNRTIPEILAAVPPTFLNFLVPNTPSREQQLIELGNRYNDSRPDLSPTNRVYVSKQRRLFAHSFDPPYWQFSLDQQVDYDLPKALETVLSKNGRSKQAILIADSTGGGIVLMALSDKPDYYTRLVSRVILWSPALNLGTGIADDNDLLAGAVAQIGKLTYRGSIPPAIFNLPLQRSLQAICNPNPVAQITFCNAIQVLLFGPTDKYSYYKPFLYAAFPKYAGILEFAHTLQDLGSFQPKRYRFLTAEENIRAYGQENPPVYNLSLITHPRVHLYGANADRLVSPQAVEISSSQMTVNHTLKIVGRDEPGVNFNHAAYFLHDLAPRLVVIPSMWKILS